MMSIENEEGTDYVENEEAYAEGQDADEGSSDQGDADESQDEEQDESQDEVAQQAAAPKISRGERRIQTLSATARAAEEKADRLEKKLQEFEADKSRQRAHVSEQEEQAQLSMMTVEEQMRYKMDKLERTMREQTQIMQFQAQDAADRASYKAGLGAKYEKYEASVEQSLAAMRRNGGNAARKELLAYHIGLAALNSGKTVAEAKKQGQKNIQRQTTSLNSPSGDQAPRGRSQKSLEERLANVQI